MNASNKGKGLWRSRGYPSWFTADTATATGVALRTLAISLIGYSVSGSTVAAGWLGSLSMIAQQGCGIFGGTYVDRHDRRTLIIVNAAVGFLSWGAVALLSLLGALSFPLLLAIAVASSAVNGFLGSAADAMLKSIIDIRDYPKARSLNEGRDSAINMAGRPMGGFLYSIHPWLPFLTASLMYAVAGVAASRIPGRKPAQERNGDADAGKAPGTSFARDFIDGWAWSLRRRLLVVILIAAGLMNFGINGIQYAIQLHLASNGTNATYIGFVSSGIFLSTLIGSLISGRLSDKAAVGTAVCGAFVFICLAALPMAFTDSYWTVLLANSLMGLPVPLINALLLGFVFAKTPPDMQGRATVMLTVPSQALSSFCSAAAGSLLPVLGFQGAVLVFLLVLVASALLVSGYPPIRRIPESDRWPETRL